MTKTLQEPNKNEDYPDFLEVSWVSFLADDIPGVMRSEGVIPGLIT